MNAGILRINLAIIEKAIGLPEGHHIERIQYDIEDSHSRTVKLLIIGPTLPQVPEGQEIPWVEAWKEADGQISFKW